MIRRDHHLPDGRSCWALISQVEHARLSGEMAAAWGSAECRKPEFISELLPAIHHHDDGWPLWERQPGVDPDSGRPLNFTEMPLDESLEIWKRSIYAVTQYGPLAGYVVSGHFAALLQHQNAWQKTGSVQHEPASAFLDSQARCRIDWLAQWQRKLPAFRTSAAAETSLHWLQFFDALSLWLCTASRVEPQQAGGHREAERGSSVHHQPPRPAAMPLPGGGQLRLTPLASRQSCESIGLEPWPFATPELELGLSARCVPVQPYRTPAELASVPSTTVVLNWRMVLAPGTKPPAGENP